MLLSESNELRLYLDLLIFKTNQYQSDSLLYSKYLNMLKRAVKRYNFFLSLTLESELSKMSFIDATEHFFNLSFSQEYARLFSDNTGIHCCYSKDYGIDEIDYIKLLALTAPNRLSEVLDASAIYADAQIQQLCRNNPIGIAINTERFGTESYRLLSSRLNYAPITSNKDSLLKLNDLVNRYFLTDRFNEHAISHNSVGIRMISADVKYIQHSLYSNIYQSLNKIISSPCDNRSMPKTPIVSAETACRTIATAIITRNNKLKYFWQTEEAVNDTIQSTAMNYIHDSSIMQDTLEAHKSRESRSLHADLTVTASVLPAKKNAATNTGKRTCLYFGCNETNLWRDGYCKYHYSHEHATSK